MQSAGNVNNKRVTANYNSSMQFIGECDLMHVTIYLS